MEISLVAVVTIILSCCTVILQILQGVNCRTHGGTSGSSRKELWPSGIERSPNDIILRSFEIVGDPERDKYFKCFCHSSEDMEMKGSSFRPNACTCTELSDEDQTEYDFSDNEITTVTGTDALFNLLQDLHAKSRTHIWDPRQQTTGYKTDKLSNYNQEDKHQISVKEVHTNSNIKILYCKDYSPNEAVDRNNCHEKSNQAAPIHVNTSELKGRFKNISILKEARRATRRSKLPYKRMQAPYMNHIDLERKRKSRHSGRTGHKFIATVPTLTEADRSKREMHIMMARYRQEIKGPKKSRPKSTTTTRRPSSREEEASSTPYPVLNVSFTGSWDREKPKTTVKPRVTRPLKITEEDLDFVHGKEERKKLQQGQGGKSQKGSFSGGWR